MLMRQCFARKGVDAVVTHGQNDSFGLANLKSLLHAWQNIRAEHGAKHCKKTQSRSAAFTGDTWLEKLIDYLEKGPEKVERLLQKPIGRQLASCWVRFALPLMAPRKHIR